MDRRASLSFRTMAFLAPLMLGYSLALLLATGVPLQVLGAVAMQMSLALMLLGGGICAAYAGISWTRSRRSGLDAEQLCWIAAGALCAALVLPSFGLFKQMVLPLRGFPFDAELAWIGRAALGGLSPWQVTHWLFGSFWATLALDKLYTSWTILFFCLPLVAPLATRCPRTRAQVLIAWVLAWVLIGSLGAWALGSAGPCYYNALIGPDPDYIVLNQRLGLLAAEARAHGMELSNIAFQPVLLDALHAGRYAPAGGISAAPSMHVAMAVLIALAGRRVAPALGRVLAGYAGVIWIGSVHFGWHYAADGPIAAVMMIATWKLAGLLVDRLSRERVAAKQEGLGLAPARG